MAGNPIKWDKRGNSFALPGIIGPAVYSIVLTVLGMLWNRHNPINQGMSELSAVNARGCQKKKNS